MKLLFLTSALAFTISTGNAQPSVANDNAELIFQSGFEGHSQIVHKKGNSDIIGHDHSLERRSNWVKHLDGHPGIGDFSIQYQGGDSTMRFARIVQEPGNPGNRVLHFWLDHPNVGSRKGRIQANIYNNIGLREVYQSVRVFLPADFETVRSYPKKIHWLTIAEFWNNVTWNQQVPYGFRITLGIGKPHPGESNLHFILDAEDCELYADGKQKYTVIWDETNTDVAVPIGKWFTMDYYYKEGNSEHGRFHLSITPEGGEKQIVFDVRNITHNTADPAPDGLGSFNPLKLYTSKDLIAYMHERGKTLQIFWDDFKLWKNKTPD